MRMVNVIAGLLCVSTVLGAELKSDDLIFEYQASSNLALAQSGGAVEGQYKKGGGSIVLVKTPEEGEMLEFNNPGTDSLSFAVQGNLAQAEGTIIINQSYHYDSDKIVNNLREGKQWGRAFYLFSSGGNTGVRLFHEINKKMTGDQIRITVMISYGQDQWKYEGITLKREDFLPYKMFEVGISWKGEVLALMVNGRIVRKTTLKAPPVWGNTLVLGGTGDNAFEGRIKTMKIYSKAAF